MTDAEAQMAQVMAAVEASSDMADILDRLKVNLEQRGWTPTAAETAAITITNTQIQLVMLRPG